MNNLNIRSNKLASTFDVPYKIMNKIYYVNYHLDKHRYYTGTNPVINHVSKLPPYNYSDKLKLSHEAKQTKVKK